jgi:single-stranded-DNA-specific exonuclease
MKIAPDRLDGFREDLCRVIAALRDPGNRHGDLNVDAEIRLADVSHRAVRELDKLGPFGAENPRPLFAATRVELAGPPKRMGEGGRHVSLRLRQYGATLRAVAFSRGDWAEEIAAAPGPLSVCFAPMINHFRGEENVELNLHDWQRESDGVTG